MKLALVTDYLNVYGGAERLLESILKLFPRADVFTSFYDPSKFPVGSPIRKVRVSSVLDSRGIIPKIGIIPIRGLIFLLPKHLTFLLSLFFERLDLSDYDLIISLGTIWAKGVRTNRESQKHIFYCLTPPRFLYGYPSETSKRNVWYYRPFTALIDHGLRIWDFKAAQRPDEIISISQEVQRRVKKFYRRDSFVIYPPVGIASSVERKAYSVDEYIERSNTKRYPLNAPIYFLLVSRLAAYKGIELAIGACDRLQLPLKIVGTGREAERLKQMSNPGLDSGAVVEFLGFRSDAELVELYKNCRAVIFPTVDEDFGIVPVEANSFGKPVIAPRSGGVLETQVEGQTAVFFEPGSLDSLIEVLKNFEVSKFSAMDCIQNAQRFSEERFKKEFRDLVDQVLAEAKK